MRNRLCLVLIVLFLYSLSAAADSKIKTRNTVMGHSTDSTVYIKGARERTEAASMGMGPSMVTLTQCDQKRIIVINPMANTCMVTPLAGDSAGDSGAAPAATGASRKGGTITFNVNVVDTGERQTILGLTARHIKTTMNAESSADACSKASMHSESDGWYADVAPGFSCSMGMMPPPSRSPGRSGCQDAVRFKRTGGGHPGYPLKQSTTVQAEGQSFTMVSEVVELTRDTLDASLFEMPSGCRVVSSYQELYSMAGMAAAMAGGRTAAPPPPSTPPPPAATPEPPAPAAPAALAVATKSSGVVRVGVVKIKDSSEQYLPLDNLRINLMSEVTLRQLEAVPLDADGESSIAAEAAAKNCDYILYTDAAQVKAPDSGGVVLPAALKGVALDKAKYQALLAITLYRAGKPLPELKQLPLAAAADKLGVNAVMAAFELEADKVAEQVKKDREPPKKAAPAPAKKPAPRKKPG